MLDMYEITSLSKKKVALKTGFLDWNMQPSIFKHYPSSLFSYSLSTTPQLKLLHLSRCVTSQQNIAGKSYKRLSIPSAGNLHPLEIYVQIRGIKGILSGIYHLDSDKDKLVLVRDIEGDGIELNVGLQNRFKGMIIMVSCVPFRSSWKYQERAFRYCFLDLGHQLGGLAMAAESQQTNLTFLSDFDSFGLNECMGFDEQEQLLSVVLCGEEGSKPAKPLSSSLMRVQPTDYYENSTMHDEVFKRYQGRGDLSLKIKNSSSIEEFILNRRSAREFLLQSATKEQLECIMHSLLQLPQSITCHIILMRSEANKPGIYQGSCLKREGVFIEETVDLLLHQQFIFNASFVLVFSSFGLESKLLTQSAYFVHVLSSHIRSNGLGLSGIGAFYDKELQDFLQTEEKILYTAAVGSV